MIPRPLACVLLGLAVTFDLGACLCLSMYVCTCAGRVLERGTLTAEATADARALCVSFADAAPPEAIPNRIGCSRARIHCDCRLVSWLVSVHPFSADPHATAIAITIRAAADRPTALRCAANERTNEDCACVAVTQAADVGPDGVAKHAPADGQPRRLGSADGVRCRTHAMQRDAPQHTRKRTCVRAMQRGAHIVRSA
jgi:hypothetical protein